jgi:hypothetical protein
MRPVFHSAATTSFRDTFFNGVSKSGATGEAVAGVDVVEEAGDVVAAIDPPVFVAGGEDNGAEFVMVEAGAVWLVSAWFSLSLWHVSSATTSWST